MRKLTMMMSMLLAFGLSSACSNEDEFNIPNSDDLYGEGSNSPSDTIYSYGLLTPVEGIGEYAKMAEFFNSELCINWDYPNVSTFFADLQDECNKPDKDIYHVINNQEELKGLYHGKLALPIIDFKEYSLVIGVQIMPNTFFKIERQELLSDDDSLRLTLYVSLPKDRYYAYTLKPMYYWGLYPKVKSNKMSVNYIIIEK